ncbi:ABC transporter permease [Pseudonocardia lacus]|uniref:ABC transporter permease n=1 Tax=Pseudonocardia lacus TaxID=2835865 RepID=UPI001BDD1D0C|nr:ABC transporter permease [Pseudonocardia lacus]
MRAAVLRAVLTESWRRPGRQLLIGLVVVVATAFAAASLLLTDSARSAIVRELAGTPEAAALVVTPPATAGAPSVAQAPVIGEEPPPGVPAAVAQRVTRTPGVAAVAGFGAGGVLLSAPGAPGDGEPWTAMSVVDGPLSRFPVVAGRLPTESDEAAVSEETARRRNLQPGAEVTLAGADGRPIAFTVTGVATVRLQAVNTVLLRPDMLTRMTGADPTQLDVLLAPGVTPAQVGPQLAAAVGGAAVVTDAVSVRAAELSSAFGSLEGIFAALAVFGGTAVLAAALTTSCVYATVAQSRRRTVLLLRRVGAGRGQLLRALLVDAASTGLLAGLLGIGLSQLLVDGVRLAIRRLMGQDLPAPAVPTGLLVGCVVGAVVVTVVAAVGTAVRVSGEHPAAPDEGSEPVHSPLVTAARLVVAGVLGTAAAAAVVLAAGTADPTIALVLVSGAGIAAFGAVVAAGPVLLPVVAWSLGTLLSPVIGAAGRLAVRSTRNAPNRASTTAAALVLASLLLAVVLVGLESMSSSVQDRIESKFPADVTAVAAGQQALPADLPQRIAALPETGQVAVVQSATMRSGEASMDVTAVDTAAFPALCDGATDAGSLADLVPGTIALDRAQAAVWGVGLGDPLTFDVPGQPVELRVVAVYRSSGVLGPVTVHPTDLPRIVPDPPTDRQLLVDPVLGADPEALRLAVSTAVAADQGVLVQVPADLRTELSSTMDLTRGVAYGLIAATVLVAVCGVAVALALAVRERHRESTTLRALGLTPAQAVASIGVESTLLGLAGVVIGTGLGMLFGVLAVAVLQERAVVPVGTLLLSAVALVAVAALAGTLPALAAARRPPIPVTD